MTESDVIEIVRKVYEGYYQLLGQKPCEDTSSTVPSTVKYLLNHSEVSIQDLHALWVLSMTKQGWVYGEQVDTVAKTHPQIVPYDQVDQNEQFKDMFTTVLLDVLRPHIT